MVLTEPCEWVPGPYEQLNIPCEQCGHLVEFHVSNGSGCELCKIPGLVTAAVRAELQQEQVRARAR